MPIGNPALLCVLEKRFSKVGTDGLPQSLSSEVAAEKGVCLCETETFSPNSVSAETVNEAHLSDIENLYPECLEEVLGFLYPLDYGNLAQTSKTMARTVVPISEHLISAFLPPHLLMAPLKAARQPDPWTIDEFRICDPLKPEKSWSSTFHQVAPLVLPPILRWGSNMIVYQNLVTMDVSGLWRVSGTYTNGGGYDYTMRLQQIGSRRGATRLEVFVEGEVRWSDTDIMVVGGKIDGNMAVFHEMMLSSTNVLGAHLANVVSAVISNDGQFMSGSWLQHDMHQHLPHEPPGLIHDEQNLVNHHYPLRVLCSGIFRAVKESGHATIATEHLWT